jgi:hypothetical protein
VTEDERAAAEREFLDHHSGGRPATAAHPACTCVAAQMKAGKVTTAQRRACPAPHGRNR